MLQNIGTLLLLTSLVPLFACSTPSIHRTPPLPDIRSLGEMLEFTSVNVSDREESILAFLFTTEASSLLRSAVLLKDGDRNAAVFYGNVPNAAEAFRMLKKYVYDIASDQYTGLMDEKVERKGFRTMEVFGFSDSALLDERFLFARIEGTLYEFHVPQGKEGWVQELLFELAKREKVE